MLRYGVALDERAASIATYKLDNVICAPVDESLSLPSQNFDCIIFNDVLEHLVDPLAALLYSKKRKDSGHRKRDKRGERAYMTDMWAQRTSRKNNHRPSLTTTRLNHAKKFLSDTV